MHIGHSPDQYAEHYWIASQQSIGEKTQLLSGDADKVLDCSVEVAAVGLAGMLQHGKDNSCTRPSDPVCRGTALQQ
jgi:hypothetical protein